MAFFEEIVKQLLLTLLAVSMISFTNSALANTIWQIENEPLAPTQEKVDPHSIGLPDIFGMDGDTELDAETIAKMLTILDVDQETAEVLYQSTTDNIILKDKDNVYLRPWYKYEVELIEDADAESFEIVAQDWEQNLSGKWISNRAYAIDKHAFYFISGDSINRKQVDIEQFQIEKYGMKGDEKLAITFGNDQNVFWYYDPIYRRVFLRNDVDFKSFEVLFSNPQLLVAQDNNFIWLFTDRPESRPSGLSICDTDQTGYMYCYALYDNKVPYALQNLNGIHIDTFAVVHDAPLLIKDMHGVYKIDAKTKTIRPLDAADTTTIQPLMFNEKLYFRDKDSVWYYNSKIDAVVRIPNMSPDEFFLDFVN